MSFRELVLIIPPCTFLILNSSLILFCSKQMYHKLFREAKDPDGNVFFFSYLLGAHPPHLVLDS